MSKSLASLMRNYFPKRPSGTLLHTLSKFYDLPVGFVTPPSYFEAGYCFICGRRRVAVVRYRMICLVLHISFRSMASYTCRLLVYHMVMISCRSNNSCRFVDYQDIRFLCRLRSIATHRDHFFRRLSVCPSVCLSVRLSHSQSYVSQATRAFLGMLPLYFVFTISPKVRKILILFNL